MTRLEQVHRALHGAATELAEARRHDSDTCEEWDGLERAITAAEESTEPSYGFDGDQFVRQATLADGTERADSVFIEDIEIIAQSIEEDVDPNGNGWFVVDELVAPSGRTWTRCLVAVECMKRAGLLHERGIDHRISRAAGFSADRAIDAFRIDAGLT